MRKLACLAATMLATGALGATTVSSASAMTPPCPVHQLVTFNSDGSITIQYGCFAPITVGPIATTLPPL
jgi:hypothetical protein